MSRLSPRILLLLLMLTVVLTACSGGGGSESDDGATTSAATATAAGTATPIPRPLGGNPGVPTPTPLPNPIGGPPNGYRTYMNESQGFAFHHPRGWDVSPVPVGGAEVLIQAPGGAPQVIVYRTIEASDSPLSERMDQVVGDFTAALKGSPRVERRGAVTLDDGTPAERTDLFFGGSGLEAMIRLQVVARQAQTYLVTASAPVGLFGNEEDAISTVLDSLVLFPAAGYGVARERALTMAWLDPITLDPAMSRESRSHLIVAHLYSGLVRFDHNLRVRLDLAASVEVDDSGTIYTFTLRDDASFHDGRAITAEDVRYSIERATEPELHSATAAAYLGDIVGVIDKLEGRADSVRGVRVVDERTVRITVDAPKAYFLAKLTYPAGAIVDKETIEGRGVEWWRQPNGSGPFELREWTEGEVLVLERYSLHPARSTLEYAVFPIQAGVPMRMYEADLVDVAFIGGADIDRALDPANAFAGQLDIFPQFNSNFVGFNTQEPPFDDRDTRLAFAMAIDRAQMLDVVFDGKAELAQGLLPPGMPGSSEGLRGIPHDPARAKALFDGAKYAGNFPPVVYTTSGFGTVPADVQFLVEAWSDVLGVTVEVRQLEPDSYFYQLEAQVDNLFDYGWIADYPDPENFLDLLFHSEHAGNNVGDYANPAFDRLVEAARTEQDFDRRMAIYAEAEQMLVDDAALIPLSHGPDYVLTKPYVEGFTVSPLGIPLLQNVRLLPRE